MVYCYGSYYPGRRYCNGYGYSRWSGWGRWVLLGVILFVALLAFVLFACISARRRRKFGHKPYKGTAWLAPRRNNNNQPQQQQMQYGTGNYNTTNYQAKPNVMEQGGAAQSYYQPQPPAYGQQTAAPGTYQPPTQPPPAANPTGWR